MAHDFGTTHVTASELARMQRAMLANPYAVIKMNVHCPACGSGPNKRCRGMARPRDIHPERRAAAKRALDDYEARHKEADDRLGEHLTRMERVTQLLRMLGVPQNATPDTAVSIWKYAVKRRDIPPEAMTEAEVREAQSQREMAAY